MSISQTVHDRLFESLITAATFVAALSWRETFIQLLDHYLPGENSSIWSEVIVTAAVTVVVIVLIVLFVSAKQTIDQTFHINDEDNSPTYNRS